MRGSLVGKRYARALFRLCNGDIGKAKKALSTLKVVNELFEDKKIRKVLVSPAMPPDLKADILNYAVDKADGGEEMRRFLKAIVGARRVAVIPDVSVAFHNLINESEGVVDATVTTVLPLGQDELNNLARQLERIEKRKINIHQQIDKNILGGLVVRVGNNLLDLSLRTKLDSIAHSAAR